MLTVVLHTILKSRYKTIEIAIKNNISEKKKKMEITLKYIKQVMKREEKKRKKRKKKEKLTLMLLWFRVAYSWGWVFLILQVF